MLDLRALMILASLLTATKKPRLVSTKSERILRGVPDCRAPSISGSQALAESSEGGSLAVSKNPPEAISSFASKTTFALTASSSFDSMASEKARKR